jgi:hypothetical protein
MVRAPAAAWSGHRINWNLYADFHKVLLQRSFMAGATITLTNFNASDIAP